MIVAKVNGQEVRIAEHKAARGHGNTDAWTVWIDGKAKSFLTMSKKYGYADFLEEGIEITES